MYSPEKRVKLLDEIRSNILTATRVTDRELAKQIAREWVKKAI